MVRDIIHGVPTKKKTDVDPCLFGMYLAVK